MSRHSVIAGAMLAAVVTLGASGLPHAPALIWNASASVPEGLYRLPPAPALHVGDLVAIAPPEPLATFLAARRYLPHGALLVKPVAALSGQAICRTGVRVRIDGRLMATALLQDSRGRRLPAWSGCHSLRAGEIFLMNPAVRDSFDGRYFGALPAAAVIGRAMPVWLLPAVRPPPAPMLFAPSSSPGAAIP